MVEFLRLQEQTLRLGLAHEVCSLKAPAEFIAIWLCLDTRNALILCNRKLTERIGIKSKQK